MALFYGTAKSIMLSMINYINKRELPKTWAGMLIKQVLPSESGHDEFISLVFQSGLRKWPEGTKRIIRKFSQFKMELKVERFGDAVEIKNRWLRQAKKFQRLINSALRKFRKGVDRHYPKQVIEFIENGEQEKAWNGKFFFSTQHRRHEDENGDPVWVGNKITLDLKDAAAEKPGAGDMPSAQEASWLVRQTVDHIQSWLEPDVENPLEDAGEEYINEDAKKFVFLVPKSRKDVFRAGVTQDKFGEGIYNLYLQMKDDGHEVTVVGLPRWDRKAGWGNRFVVARLDGDCPVVLMAEDEKARLFDKKGGPGTTWSFDNQSEVFGIGLETGICGGAFEDILLVTTTRTA